MAYSNENYPKQPQKTTHLYLCSVAFKDFQCPQVNGENAATIKTKVKKQNLTIPLNATDCFFFSFTKYEFASNNPISHLIL